MERATTRRAPSPPSRAALERLLLVHNVTRNRRARGGAILRCACDLCGRAEELLHGR